MSGYRVEISFHSVLVTLPVRHTGWQVEVEVGEVDQSDLVVSSIGVIGSSWVSLPDVDSDKNKHE